MKYSWHEFHVHIKAKWAIKLFFLWDKFVTFWYLLTTLSLLFFDFAAHPRCDFLLRRENFATARQTECFTFTRFLKMSLFWKTFWPFSQDSRGIDQFDRFFGHQSFRLSARKYGQTSKNRLSPQIGRGKIFKENICHDTVDVSSHISWCRLILSKFYMSFNKRKLFAQFFRKFGMIFSQIPNCFQTCDGVNSDQKVITLLQPQKLLAEIYKKIRKFLNFIGLPTSVNEANDQ